MEIKDLNIIPEGEKPIIHASQYDENRTIRFNLFDGEEEYTLESGITLVCNLKKLDGNIVTFEVTNTEAKYIDLVFPLQATTCAGVNVGEVVLTDSDDYVIGTINFVLEVEKSPMLGGVESTTSIHDLTTQIEEITAQVIGNDYYNKTEVDSLLENKADISDLPDMNDYYDKTEVDGLLENKADISDLPDMTNYYTKSETSVLLDTKADKNTTYSKNEVDGLLATKANISDLPDMSNYYTKTEVDNNFLNIMPVNTVSGAIANFTTLISAPLVNLISNIVAQQAGSETPSPQNVRPISGFSSVTLTQKDTNDNIVDTFTIQLGQTVYGGVLDVTSGLLTISKGYIDLTTQSWEKGTQQNNPNGTYFLASGDFSDVLRYDTFISNVGIAGSGNIGNSPANSMWVNLARNGVRWIFGEPEGGSSLTDLQTFIANNAAYIIYDLATPITLTLTPDNFTTLVGENNIFADSGDVEVSFRQDIQNYVDDKTSNASRSVNLMRVAAPEESEGDTDER